MRKVYQKRLKKQGGNWNIIAQKTKQGQMLLSEIRTIMLSFFQHMQNHHFSDVIQIPTQNQMAQTWVLLHLQSSDNHVYLILVVNEVISYHRLLFFLVPSISSDHVPFFFFFSCLSISQSPCHFNPVFFKTICSFIQELLYLISFYHILSPFLIVIHSIWLGASCLICKS